MIINLVLLVSVVILVSLAFRLLENKGLLGKMGFWPKQILIGIVFGLVAFHSTAFGVDIGGAIINVRDSAPLCAGLIFGGPAGIIAGLIGGITRWFYGAGEYTRLACTISTILAGFIAAFLRKNTFKDKMPSWITALLIGIGMELLHMLIIILTHINDMSTVMATVQQLILPMAAANGVAMMLSVMLCRAIKD